MFFHLLCLKFQIDLLSSINKQLKQHSHFCYYGLVFIYGAPRFTFLKVFKIKHFIFDEMQFSRALSANDV